MSHAVHYRSEEGGTRFEQLGTLDDALARVEQLRNEQGVSEVRVYREVPVAFRAYYKATVVEEGAPTPPQASEPPPHQEADGPAEEPAPTADAAQASSPPPGAMPLSPPPPVPSTNGRDDEEEVDAAREGRGSLFGRG